MPMQHEILIFNRQNIRLCKGILKAWEQWVNENECLKEQEGHGVGSTDVEPQMGRKRQGIYITEC
jgi:hypothetical protein